MAKDLDMNYRDGFYNKVEYRLEIRGAAQ